MRALSAQAQATIDTGRGYRVITRVWVKDAAGAWQELSDYCGFDPFVGAEWGETVDDVTVQATISLLREKFFVSLAPLMEESPVNRDWDPANPFAALIKEGREIKVETAVVPLGVEPVSGDWDLMFHGRIDAWNAEASPMRIEARDLTCDLIDAYIEEERVYAYGAVGSIVGGFRQWEPNKAWALNTLVIPTDANLNGHYFKVTTAGTGGATEPTWPTSSTVADGTAVFTEQGATSTAGKPVEKVMQEIANDNASSPPTLAVPSSPSWNIREYQQDRVPTFDAIRALAEQIGWSTRQKYDAGSGTFKLTLFEPDRAKTTPDAVLDRNAYLSVNRLRVDRAGIRNAIRVIYSDSADLDAGGYPKRKVVEVTDSASITEYGRRFMELAEDSTSNIDSSTEANAMANAALADLSTPLAELEVTRHFYPAVELGDLYTFSANGRHFSGDQNLAVVGFRHSLSRDQARTTLTCRGKPAGGYKRWHNISAHPKKKPNHRIRSFNVRSAPTLTVEPTVAGAKATWFADKIKQGKFDEIEWHMSQSSGFTPSAATLQGITKAEQFEFRMNPGETYYVKAVPRGRNDSRPVRGQPTAQQTIVAGYAAPFHGDPEGLVGVIPANHNFGAATQDIATYLPDKWKLPGGSRLWADDTNTIADSTSLSGSRSIKFLAAGGAIHSDYFPVIAGVGGGRFVLEVWAQAGAIGAVLDGGVMFENTPGGGLSVRVGFSHTFAAANTWERIATIGDLPTATYKYVHIELERGATDPLTHAIIIDSCLFRRWDLPVDAWTAPTLLNFWVNYNTGTHQAAGYMKTALGFLKLKGSIKSGTTAAGTVLFTLPSGYRPLKETVLIGSANGVPCEIIVQTDGDVTLGATGGSATRTSLDGLEFPLN